MMMEMLDMQKKQEDKAMKPDYNVLKVKLPKDEVDYTNTSKMMEQDGYT